MKKHLFLFVVLFFAVGTLFAQDDPNNGPNGGEEPQALTDVDPSDYDGFISKPTRPDMAEDQIPPFQSLMALTSYSDRPSFEAAACNVAVEPFNHNATVTGCNEPVNSTLNNCFPGGQLIPGFELTAEGTNGGLQPAMVLIGNGAFATPSSSIATNFFTAWMRIDLDLGVEQYYSIGWDFYEIFFNLPNYAVDVYDTGGVLMGSGSIANNGFIGFTSDVQIGYVDFYATPQNTSSVELIDNLSLGTSCGGGGSDCLTNTCVQVICPPDITVDCIDDVIIDAADAIVITSCAAEAGRWVTNPDITGVPGCPGTEYRYLYKAVDADGEVGCCERIITIADAQNTITAPAGGTVNCYENIPDLDVNDATVGGTACPDYNLYLSGPDVVGSFGCPGTQYIYTYRMVDACGRIIEDTQTFTETNNAPPVVNAPDDITCSCLGGVNPNPNNAEVTVSCGSDYTVAVTGPQIFGPIDCPNTVYRYTYTVTDACGRMSSDIQDFTVSNGPPSFDGCPGDNWLVLNCEDFGGEGGTIAVIQAWLASVSASTSCGVPLTVFNNFNSNPNAFGTCINGGTTTVTFRATDNCGRSSFCTGTVIVNDTEPPVITGEAQDVWELCNYNTPDNFDDWVDNNGGATADDECWDAPVSWSTSPANPSLSCMGQMGTTSVTVTFIARDNCGNTSETTATYNALMGGGDFVDQGGNDQLDDRATITLGQNRPNPFKDETVISFNLPEASAATLVIYDMNGKVVKVVEGTYSSGYNEVSVNSSDLGATGVMYYRLMTDKDSVTKTMLVID